MEVKAYTSFAQGLLLAGAVSLYARLAARWSRRVLIVRSTLFCMSNLVIFWLLRPGFLGDVPGAGIVFYIWVGMFGVFVVSQFWAFAADLYTNERGERLLPLIAIGATSGAVIGSFFTRALLNSGLVDSSALLLVAILPLAGSIVLTALSDTRGAVGMPDRRPVPRRPPRARPAVLPLLLHHRYLLAVAGVTLFTAWVSTNGENLLFKVVQEALATRLAADGVTNSIEMKSLRARLDDRLLRQLLLLGEHLRPGAAGGVRVTPAALRRLRPDSPAAARSSRCSPTRRWPSCPCWRWSA